MSATNVDFENVRAGASWAASLTYTTDGTTPVPGLDGYTARFVVRRDLTSDALIDVEPDFDDETAIVSLGLSPAQTRSLGGGVFLYGVTLSAPGGEPVVPLAHGSLKVEPEVVRD